jgi:hypothetical protein
VGYAGSRCERRRDAGTTAMVSLCREKTQDQETLTGDSSKHPAQARLAQCSRPCPRPLLSRRWSPTAQDCPRTRIYRHGSCCLPHRLTASASRISHYAAQWLTRRFPLSTLQRRPREHLRMTRGRNDLRNLSRVELSSTISCQLQLAHQASDEPLFPIGRHRLHSGLMTETIGEESGASKNDQWRMRKERPKLTFPAVCTGMKVDSGSPCAMRYGLLLHGEQGRHG